MTVPAHTAPFNLCAARPDQRSSNGRLCKHGIHFPCRHYKKHHIRNLFCFAYGVLFFLLFLLSLLFYFPASPFKDSNSCISDAVSFRLDVIVSPDAFVMLTSRTDPSPIPCLPAACKNFENFGWFAEKVSQAFLIWNNFVGFIICSRTPFLPFV